MAIDAVEGEESLDFCCKFVDICINLFVVHSVEHRDRAETLNFTKLAEHTKLSICQTHILFISLSYFSSCQWPQLSSRSRLQNLFNHLKFMQFIEIVEYFS